MSNLTGLSCHALQVQYPRACQMRRASLEYLFRVDSGLFRCTIQRQLLKRTLAAAWGMGYRFLHQALPAVEKNPATAGSLGKINHFRRHT